jgi:hypothetical protein
VNLKKTIKTTLLKILTRIKITEFDIKNTGSILFFRYDCIGDMIISTLVFRELKFEYPKYKLTLKNK